jgi:flagellar basal-body rod modification protein FlgD
MTSIPTTSLSSPTATTGATGTSSTDGTLDQAAFLKLMTTQLQTQDPFNPVDNTQMVAQMAQFSSVAGISQMNTTLSSIQASLAGSRVGDAASWIGRSALVNSDTATPLGDGSYRGQLTLPSDATNVGISFVDANGSVVHSQTLGAQAKGDVNFSWDGKDPSGNVTANGPLKIVVTAANTDGQITPTTATWTGISAVQSPAGGSDAMLVTPLGLISPNDALSLG